MSNILGALLVLAQAGSTSIPAVDVTAAEVRRHSSHLGERDRDRARHH